MFVTVGPVRCDSEDLVVHGLHLDCVIAWRRVGVCLSQLCNVVVEFSKTIGTAILLYNAEIDI
jgi:hypothetical protein